MHVQVHTAVKQHERERDLRGTHFDRLEKCYVISVLSKQKQKQKKWSKKEKKINIAYIRALSLSHPKCLVNREKVEKEREKQQPTLT